MATIGGQDYTNFKAVNLRGSVFLRAQGSGGSGTFSVDHLEADRAWSFPDKSGRFPIMGTFAVQLPAISATNFVYATVVTVAGVRSEDALSVTLNGGVSAGYGDFAGTSGSTARILWRAIPGAGNITLVFSNVGAATGYVEWIGSYLAMR